MSNASLPTPPSTSHRDREKENRNPRFSAASRRVVWAEEHQYHLVPNSPPSRSSFEASGSKEQPTKSILKRTSHALLPLINENQKETTPEPSDPLVDLKYLEGPVSRILASDAALGDLIEAYSILAARLRASVTAVTDVDSSWPLFQPLRKNRDAFVDALVRDLGRALVDPQTVPVASPEEPYEGERLSGLPSPQKSPKKRQGMSADQVKFARDLCTTCHAVIKLLSAMFTMPAVYSVFTDVQLGFILTHVLAIPLADELPTPNARKTNALAIWLIQTQRLPGDVLASARDRIAYALRRGIEGELGKEGKKGSAGDGLKAIHDLSMSYPTVFVPAFIDLLPSIFSNLLAPTLLMRNQACNALGGFAFALGCLPNSDLHARVSSVVVAHLTAASATSSASDRPNTPSKDSALVRTLRTTLSAKEPSHAAQGPVWAWLVLAHLIVMLGPAVYTNTKVARQVTALAVLGMRHTRSSVRALGSLIWRCMTWAYFRPPLVRLEDEESDAEVDEGETELDDEDGVENGLGEVWKVVQSIVDMGAGVATLGALLGGESTRRVALRRSLSVLRVMSKRGGQTCKDALDAASRLVSLAPEQEWRPLKLLVPGLFSALPGLLTAEYKTLSATVRPLFEDCPQLEDIRSLTKEELGIEWVFQGLLDIWKEGVLNLRLSWGCDIPAEIQDVWFGLLRANVLVLQDDHDEDGITALAERAVDVLIDILKDREFEPGADPDELDTELPSPVKPSKRSPTHGIPAARVNLGLKFYLVNELWLVVKTAFEGSTLNRSAAKLLQYLHRNELNLIEDMDAADIVRRQWAYMCSDIAMECDVEDLDAFWTPRRASSRRPKREWSSAVRRVMWQAFVIKWQEDRNKWEAAVMLLGVPFMDANSWDMSSGDLDVWDALLRFAVSKAIDVGRHSIDLLERVASQIWAHHAPTHASSLRIADLLLSHLEVNDAREVPADVFEFVNDALIVSYPPEPRNKVASLWLMRTLTRVIDTCPLALLVGTLRLAEAGLSTWIKDECTVFTEDEYTMDILPLYQTILLGMQSLPDLPSAALALLSVVTTVFQGRNDKPATMLQAYHEFKEALTLCTPEQCADSPSIEEVLSALDSEQDAAAAIEGVDTDVVDADTPGDGSSNTGGEVDAEDEDEELRLLQSEAQVLQMLLPPVDLPESAPSSPALPVASLPSSPVLGPLELPEPPTTPKASSKQLLSTPARPHKSAVKELAPLLLKSPSSPLTSSSLRSPSTPKRTPQSVSRRERLSSGRRRSGVSKENMSPLPVIASITERIAMRSPAVGVPSVLGKRSVFDDEHEGHVAKRNKLDTALGLFASYSPLAQDIANTLSEGGGSLSQEPLRVSAYFQGASRVGEKTLLAEPVASSSSKVPETSLSNVPEEPVISTSDLFSPDSPVTSTGSPPRLKKRKSVFLDAVEVPFLREILRLPRRARPQPESSECDTPERKQSSTAGSSSSQQTLRRTRSATSLSAEPVQFLKLEEMSRKRRRNRPSELVVAQMSSPSMSSPLRALMDVPVAGSDDSIMLASPTKHSEPPSDDDARPGPLGIASPALRRVKGTDFDPPSDDSNVSESPTRDAVARRVTRPPSLRAFMRSSPMAVRSRSMRTFSLPDSDS
ncbi:hypothetical protein B0H21DRAFT_819758 [Amylocystis lapponica]|nr:hypothetical protein B0H21DRAFT_819758 [Amylocystis lapponica]